MKLRILYCLLAMVCLFACQNPATDTAGTTTEGTDSKGTAIDDKDFVWSPDRFADLKINRYQVPGFDKLSTNQKALVYYLTEAGLAGRDIIWDQNYRHNLTIRRALENIVQNYKGDKTTDDWKNFMVYVKRIWFSNGIHHHYSMDKILPEFTREYFGTLMSDTNTKLKDEVLTAMFDPKVDNKKVSLDPNKDIVLASATNFYGPNVTEADVDKYYASVMDKSDDTPVEYGLNSQLVKDKDGKITERVWKIDGMYGEAIKEIVSWLEKAATVAENPKQEKAIKLLIEYYKTGDLEKWDEYNIAWTASTEGDIDYINSFIEVYNDPKGYRGSFENIVQITDFDASARMAKLAENVQWFEDNSPFLDEHKKANVVGVSYKVVTVAGEAGDASPSTPIGVNLPNSNWIRATHGSKSVSLGNIIHAYDKAGGPGILTEFAHDEKEVELANKYGDLADKMGTALHEVVGHASGKLEEGVATPKETLKSYASALEEGRADLVALYYIMNPKLVELGLLPSKDAGIAEYDSYIRNGLMTQLRRIEPGNDIEEAHMRNRQFISKWAYEKGKKDNVIAKVTKNGKTYFDIQDYDKLHALFGELLKEVQRIKSQGDYAAGKALVENYGVKVDQTIHQEVKARVEKLDIPPYGGFINPRLVPVMTEGKVTDVKVEYPADFEKQMLEYANKYSFLPDYN